MGPYTCFEHWSVHIWPPGENDVGFSPFLIILLGSFIFPRMKSKPRRPAKGNTIYRKEGMTVPGSHLSVQLCSLCTDQILFTSSFILFEVKIELRKISINRHGEEEETYYLNINDIKQYSRCQRYSVLFIICKAFVKQGYSTITWCFCHVLWLFDKNDVTLSAGQLDKTTAYKTFVFLWQHTGPRCVYQTWGCP